MSYISEINTLFRERLSGAENLAVYGQNIIAGSCLGGLCRDFSAGPGGGVFNSQNSENTLVGIGFGLMIKGVNAAFFMKQQDFLLLGLDQVVNTWNVLRTRDLRTSYTIVTIIVDSGFEGPQSRLNNFDDICSLAHVPGYAITNKWDAEHVIGTHFVSPGFRIIGVSQRMFRGELPVTTNAPKPSEEGDVLRYHSGEEATIVSMNFAFNQALELWENLKERGIGASLFSVPAILPKGWGDISDDAAKTKRLIIVDDSKSENRTSDRLMLDLSQRNGAVQIARAHRDFSNRDLRPNADLMSLDIEALLKQVGL